MKIVVIGGGIAGLVSACLFAKDGHSVTLLEQNKQVGGKLNQVTESGYRFDTGPSLLTMPFVLERVFEYCGTHLEEELDIAPLDPMCRYQFADGEVFENFSDLPATLKEIEKFAPDDTENYVRFLGKTANIYQKTAETFLFNPLAEWKDFKSVTFSDLFKIDAHKTVSQIIEKQFNSRHLQFFFKRFATYNGSDPSKAPATLNVIPYVELCQGGFYVKGGMYQIARSLAKLAQSMGVDIQTGVKVKQIVTKQRSVKGVTTKDDQHLSCDVVISNADSVDTYTNLFNDEQMKPRKKEAMRSLEPSSSGFVLLLGVSKQFDRLKHHNIFFPSNYEEEFKSLFDRREPVQKPAVYVANTSYTDPDDAPEGHSNLFVLVNAPALTKNHDWASLREGYAQKIINRLEMEGLTGLSKHIEYQSIIDPQDFYDQYGSHKGSIYGISSNSKFSAFLRPRNQSSEIDGLFLVGGSTHPGGGIPLVTLSALNAHTLFKRQNRD